MKVLIKKGDLKIENVEAVRNGISNLTRHVNNIKKFGLPVIVGINHFDADTINEMNALEEECKKIGVEAIPCKHWAKGGEGTKDLANNIVELCNKKKKNGFTPRFRCPC